MTTLLYFNINKMLDSEIEKYLEILPEFMKEDVRRYKYAADQKSRLIARLMLQLSMKNTNGIALIHNWKRDNNNKPFIEGWNPFSIAHSADLVLFAYGDTPMGIDIEKKIELNYEEMLQYFHPKEQEYIIRSKNSKEAFYEIWVKKEAVLKAIGTGIVNGLKEFDCLAESINYEGNSWYFHPLQLDTEYTSYLCTLCKENRFVLTEFTLDHYN